MIIYPAEKVQELLSEVDGNGVHLKKWNSDMSEIVETTEQDRASELDAIHLATKNAHGIALWKQSGGAVIQRTQEEIDADEYARTVALFDVVLFQGDLATALVNSEFSSISLRSEFAALNAYATNCDFSGLVGYLDWLVANEIATAGDKTVVVALVTKQGIEL